MTEAHSSLCWVGGARPGTRPEVPRGREATGPSGVLPDNSGAGSGGRASSPGPSRSEGGSGSSQLGRGRTGAPNRGLYSL